MSRCLTVELLLLQHDTLRVELLFLKHDTLSDDLSLDEHDTLSVDLLLLENDTVMTLSLSAYCSSNTTLSCLTVDLLLL